MIRHNLFSINVLQTLRSDSKHCSFLARWVLNASFARGHSEASLTLRLARGVSDVICGRG